MIAESVVVTLYGAPVAWARARLGVRGVPFTPPRQRNNSATLRLAAQDAMAGRLPFDCPVRIELTVEFPIPPSWSKRKQAEAECGQLMPGKKPDLSNCLKQAEDAFNAVVFRDDALIVEAVLRKTYSRQPKIAVMVEPALPALPVVAIDTPRPAADLFAGASMPKGGGTHSVQAKNRNRKTAAGPLFEVAP